MKERVDVLLVEKGFFPTREKARKNIMAGVVFIDGRRTDKAGDMVDINSSIEIKGNSLPFVSRGGLKLEKALKEFSIDVTGKTAMDVGASTGGFTDCFLKYGAEKVVSIDVGYGQFAWELRNDSRVKLMERTNIRNVKYEDIGFLCDICAIDVSFISLKLVLPVVKTLIRDKGEIICLIKPQFEAGRERVGKKGVVRDPAVHKDVITDIISFSKSSGFGVIGLSYSPIKGPEGNIEYLLYLINDDKAIGLQDIEGTVERVVDESHKDAFKNI